MIPVLLCVVICLTSLAGIVLVGHFATTPARLDHTRRMIVLAEQAKRNALEIEVARDTHLGLTAGPAVSTAPVRPDA